MQKAYLNMNKANSQILYVSIDGIMEPLGYSQVLKYLEKLSKDYSINLITFEKEADLKNAVKLNKLIKKCKDQNINWYRHKYNNGKFGLGQIINIFNLITVPLLIFIKKRIAIVHIRSYMPGIVIPILRTFFKFNLIFDMRGFWADEKHDRLNWNKKSYKYVFFKRLEKYLIDNSQKIITLTEASKDIMIQNFNAPNSLIEVIPTCVDFNEFHRVENVRRNNSLTIGYLGSIDTAYDFSKFSLLISQLPSNFKNKIHLKVLTNKTLQEVTKFIPEGTLSKIKLEVKFAQRGDLSKEISSFDFLGFYLKENFSINASMPTKIGESLACGVPIICNSFNSDIRNIIEMHDVGIIYDFKNTLSEHQIKKLFQILEEKTVHQRCLKIANEYFSLEKGAATYNDLYFELISKY